MKVTIDDLLKERIMKNPIKEEIGMDKFQKLVTDVVKMAIEDLQFNWSYYADIGETTPQQRSDDAKKARWVISAYRFLKNGGYNDYLKFINCESKLIDDGIKYALKKHKKNYDKANKIMDICFSAGLKARKREK